ncbi:MAG: ABC transporter permease [Gemmataceae bacterium]
MYFVTIIFKNLTRRRTRSILTALGIAISVAAMVSLVSIAHRFREATAESFAQRGVALIVTASGATDQLSSDLDMRLADKVRKIPNVRAVDEGLVTLTEVQKELNGTSFSVLVQGWRPENVGFSLIDFPEGRTFTSEDRGVVILGSTLASNLKKKVGDTVVIQGETFRVIGIFQSSLVYENGGAVMPLEELQRLTSRVGRITGVSVILEPDADENTVSEVRRGIESLVNESSERKGLAVLPTRDFVNTSMYFRMASAVAWLISAVAIFIGLIGMLNTMLMSVLERVREMGILRAVGWKRSRIVCMVLGESVILSLAAAVIGIIMAAIGTRLLAMLPAVIGFIEGRIVLNVAFEAVGITTLLGLIGGVYPAMRAAQLSPTEALRHE